MSDVELGDDPYSIDDGDPGPVVRIREWILIEGDRLLLALSLSVAISLLFLTLDHLDVIAFANDDSVTRLAGGMVAGTFSLVTLVVSINQLILSREFSGVEEARSRLNSIMDFRRDVEGATGVPASPAAPAKLLELLVETIHSRAGALGDAGADIDDEEVRELVVKYADYVRESAERIDENLEQGRLDTFEAVSASVRYDDAWQIYLARHLRNRYDDSLDEECLGAFDELIDALQRFNVAREQFKTVYLQRELTRFSQLTIYCGVPAILAALLVGFLYADIGGAAIRLDALPVVVSALIGVVFSPLALLVAFILRSATITRRTASVGPMLPGKDLRDRPFEASMSPEDD